MVVIILMAHRCYLGALLAVWHALGWTTTSGVVGGRASAPCWLARALSGVGAVGILAADGGRIWCVAAGAALLDGEEAQAAVEAFLGDSVVATLAVDGVGRGALAARLADMEQLGGRAGGGAALHGGTG